MSRCLEIDNQTTTLLETARLEKIAQTLSPQRMIELLFVDENTIQGMNKEYRNQDKPTDVLSFPLDAMGIANMPLGSVVICIPIAQGAAHFFGHSLEEEIALLFIHGVLHLQGYDHEVDLGEHYAAEKQWIEFFSLPSGLIVRTLEESSKKQ